MSSPKMTRMLGFLACANAGAAAIATHVRARRDVVVALRIKDLRGMQTAIERVPCGVAGAQMLRSRGSIELLDLGPMLGPGGSGHFCYHGAFRLQAAVRRKGIGSARCSMPAGRGGHGFTSRRLRRGERPDHGRFGNPR